MQHRPASPAVARFMARTAQDFSPRKPSSAEQLPAARPAKVLPVVLYAMMLLNMLCLVLLLAYAYTRTQASSAPISAPHALALPDARGWHIED